MPVIPNNDPKHVISDWMAKIGKKGGQRAQATGRGYKWDSTAAKAAVAKRDRDRRMEKARVALKAAVDEALRKDGQV